MLRWPVVTQGFALKTATNLPGPWNPVPLPIVDTPSDHTVTVPGAAQAFFRLGRGT